MQKLNPRLNNPLLTPAEEQVVMDVHTRIMEVNGFTGGWCGLATVMIVTILGDDYIPIDVWGHWFARNKHNDAILDPTADQFYKDTEAETRTRLVVLYTNDPKVIPLDHLIDSYSESWYEWASEWCENYKRMTKRNAA